MLRETGNPAEALQEYQKALAIQQRLADANPAVTDFQRRLASFHSNIGIVLRDTRKPAEALQEFQKALAITQKLADANPAVTDFQRRLAMFHSNIGVLLSSTGTAAEALKEEQKALGIFQKLADAHPANTRYTDDLGYSHAYRGRAHVRAGHPAEAAADLRRALALWEKGKAADSEALFERSRALALLAGLAADAKSGVTAAEGASFADQAVAALRDALSAGWNRPDELKEPDLDALRSRADFQKLLAEVEAKTGPTAKPKD